MNSMTGYAYVQKRKNGQQAQVIIRSLNFKYLDIIIHNLTPEKMLLEEKIKKEIKRRVNRGRVEVYIFLKRPFSKKVCIDEHKIGSYVSQVRKLSKKYHLEYNLRVSDLLHLPEVIYTEEKSLQDEGLVIPALREAVEKLSEFKKKEGQSIKLQVLKNLKMLKENVMNIDRLRPEISGKEDRDKEDIDEEIALASFYIDKMDAKVKSLDCEPKGKAMDFLTQEILRELNAASSKTKTKNLSLLIVEAKNYLERIREQAQNVE